MRLQLRGLDETKKALSRLPREARSEVDKALGEAAEAIADDVKRSILTGKRSGHMYGGHQASAPGEPPANRTGKLVESIGTRRQNQTSHSVTATAKYAGYLERGTRAMDPRPYLEPAIERGVALVKRLTKRAVAKAIEKIGKRGKAKKGLKRR